MPPEVPNVIADLPTVDEVETLVRRWLAQSRDAEPDPSAERLAGVLKDPRGLEFTLGFVDGVMRPEDLKVAGKKLEALSRKIPRFLPWYCDSPSLVGGGFATLLPWLIVPIARWVLRKMVGHLVVDATPKRLDKTLLATAPERTASTSTSSARQCSASARRTAACGDP